jgi:uncharacterized protein YndB with AHSA1/START domain
MIVEIQGASIVGHIDIEAPPEAVFDAFTDPEQLTAWWGSADTYRTFNWQVDLRPGGSYSCNARATSGGDTSIVKGTYVQVDRPHTLIYTWNPSWDAGGETEVHLKFEKIVSGTRVHILHSGFAGREQSQQGHTHGWTRVLGWLRDHVQQDSTAKSKETHS